MALTATHLIVLGRGRLIADGPVQELILRASRKAVRVRTPHATQLGHLLVGDHVDIHTVSGDTIEVSGLDSAAIGIVAMRASIPLVELIPQHATLEEVFMELTRDAVEFHAAPPSSGSPADPVSVGPGGPR